MKLHDMTIMRVAITKYTDLNSTRKSRLKEAKDRVAGCDHWLEATKRETKLELVTLRNSQNDRETTIRVLEA